MSNELEPIGNSEAAKDAQRVAITSTLQSGDVHIQRAWLRLSAAMAMASPATRSLIDSELARRGQVMGTVVAMDSVWADIVAKRINI